MENIMKTTYCMMGFILTAFFVSILANAKISEYQEQISLIEEYDFPTVSHIEQELNCMAMNIYREAAGEPFEGKVAVAQVTMNRVNHAKFPDTVCNVVYEKNVFMKRVVCQFSWHCSGKTRARPVNSRAYDESFEVAKKVMLEKFELESVKDAVYFHADTISPKWKYTQVAKIGAHIFYKERG